LSGTRILVRERDLFGQWAGRWRVIRTSNAYVFTDPLQGSAGPFSCKSENPTGTPNSPTNKSGWRCSTWRQNTRRSPGKCRQTTAERHHRPELVPEGLGLPAAQKKGLPPAG
jgi:hypothetical protein